jgi:hypothetical protein
VLIGVAETAAALLLLTRRTALAGALIMKLPHEGHEGSMKGS